MPPAAPREQSPVTLATADPKNPPPINVKLEGDGRDAFIVEVGRLPSCSSWEGGASAAAALPAWGPGSLPGPPESHNT